MPIINLFLLSSTFICHSLVGHRGRFPFTLSAMTSFVSRGCCWRVGLEEGASPSGSRHCIFAVFLVPAACGPEMWLWRDMWGFSAPAPCPERTHPCNVTAWNDLLATFLEPSPYRPHADTQAWHHFACEWTPGTMTPLCLPSACSTECFLFAPCLW